MARPLHKSWHCEISRGCGNEKPPGTRRNAVFMFLSPLRDAVFSPAPLRGPSLYLGYNEHTTMTAAGACNIKPFPGNKNVRRAAGGRCLETKQTMLCSHAVLWPLSWPLDSRLLRRLFAHCTPCCTSARTPLAVGGSSSCLLVALCLSLVSAVKKFSRCRTAGCLCCLKCLTGVPDCAVVCLKKKMKKTQGRDVQSFHGHSAALLGCRAVLSRGKRTEKKHESRFVLWRGLFQDARRHGCRSPDVSLMLSVSRGEEESAVGAPCLRPYATCPNQHA